MAVRKPDSLVSVDALSIALEVRDAYTRLHCDRTVQLAGELAKACDASREQCALLQVAACFHDVGKIGVADAVLLKPARLTSEEWAQMKAHSEHGERIFRATHLDARDKVAVIIRHHHEAYDGSGYPDGLRGDQIPLLSRIISVVDAYDAMGTARPYQPARGHAQIMDILDGEKGSRIDPEVFRAFSRLIERSPCRVQ